MANPDNRFAEAEDIDQLMLLVVGAGSACWHPDGVFDDQSADIVARDGAARAKELGSGR